MPASAHTKDEKQFWKLVWPTLKTGGWRYEEEGAAARNGGGSDQSDEGRSTAAPGGNSRRTSSRNRKRSSSSSTSSRSSNSSNSSSPAAASSPRDPSAAAAGGAAAGTTPPKKPVFVPPVVGVASEALEEAMRRSAPADGSLEEERRSRLVGVTAVIELLQQVPGFPGTTTGIVNFDAVAAAARGVMVRTPSPPTLVENGGAAGTPAGEPQLRGENAVGSPSSRSRSSSISSSDEAVIEPPSGIWSSAAGNSSSQQQVPSSVGSGGAGSADGNSDASATSATRRGRVIKKPVRLEEQDPGRQTLPGRNGRADAPAKLAGRAAAEGPAQPGAAVGDAAGLPSASGKAGGQASGEGRAAVEESTAAVVAGAERCVARLGTAANGDSVETGTRNAVQVTGSSSGKGGVEADKSSSSNSAGVAPSSSSVAGCAVRPAMLSERRTSGSGPAPQGDAEEADGADSAAGESSKKGKGSVRERDRLVVPDPPPERPFGGLGPAPDEAIKEYKRAFDDVVWPALAEEFGWTKVYGPRMHDVYYLPMGVARGQNGARCRVDYYDSNRQVLIHMAEHEEKYRGLLERAWAAAVLKPRAIGRKSAASGGSKRKKRWTEQPRRKSTMMKNEYPKKVSLVGTAYQVDPLNLPIAVSSEEYVPPEDVQFEQVWDPSVLLPSSEGAAAPPDPDMPVEELAGSVSHDKCLEILYRCGGDHDDARKMLKTLQRSWRARHHLAGVTAKETVKAREIVKTETAARLEGAPQQSSSSAATGGSGKGSKGGGSCPIVEGSTTVTATTTRSAVAWGGGAAAVASRSSGSTGSSSSSGGSSSGGGGSSSSRGGRFQGSRTGTEVQDAYWHRPFKSLAGGKHALDRQVEGGVSLSPPGVRGRERFLADQDLSKPWTPQEADTFTRALLEEGSKNFYAVQKALPGRQVCELVDRYYGGWKQTPPYKILKQSISLSKKQSACGRCHSGGDLICCDGCDAVYHPECVGISVVPEGDWFCPACVSAKKNESQRTAGGSALVPGPGAKPAVAGTNNEVPANAGRSKRARPTATVETAATAAVVASSKKPRAVVGDKAGGVASGSKPEQAPARGAGGRQARPASHMRMERVPIQLGSARGAASSVAGVSQKVSSEASAPAPAGSAATKTSASPAAPHSEKDSRVSDQLGKRPQVPQTKEQHPGKRTARGARVAAAAPAKNAAKAAPPELSAGSAVGGSGSGTAVGKGAQKAATPVRSEVLQDKPGGEWDCRGCTYRNRPEHRRCRQCEGLRLAGAEMMRKVPPPPPIASLPSPSAVPVPVAAPAPAPLVDSKSFAVKRQSVPAPCLGEIEPVFSRPASAVANAAAAAALAAAAAGARAATAPRGLIEPIFSRPASAVANAAAAAAAAAAGAASARAARAPAQPAPAPSRLWCCRACSTFNRRSAVYCVSCRTRKEFKDVEEGKPDWWCCRKCSRFNNRRQDGNTCRVCSAVDQDDAAEQEEEMISVGDEISMPGMAAAAERFVQL